MRSVCIEGASAVRYSRGWGFGLILGVALLIAAGSFGARAAHDAADVSAYHRATACLAGAAADADCLQTVVGAITGVTEYGGKNADYSLDVLTASGTMHITFISDSAMLSYATDGDPAVLTVWRGIPVSVSADGRSEATASVPNAAFAKDLGQCALFGGGGVFFALGALAMRRSRKVGPQPIGRPVAAAGYLALFLSSVVVFFGGAALGGKPSRLDPDEAVTGAALLVVSALSAWLGVATARRNRSRAALAVSPHAPQADRPMDLPAAAMPPPTVVATSLPGTAAPLRARLQRVARSPRLRAIAANWLMPTLTVGVLFGILLTIQDGPPARAYRHAPACVGESNLATCVGEFTATVNGVRTPSQADGNYADVAYVTGDGAINAWARFDGNSDALARAAEADQNDRTPLTVRVWRGSIVGGELGAAWHWADGNPPGVLIPTVYLAVTFALLLVVVRMRIHRRTGQQDSQLLLIEDLGQAAVAAGAIVLLGYGFWPGAILAVADLLWLGLSVRRSTRARRRARYEATGQPA
jgi:hypothetical protein